MNVADRVCQIASCLSLRSSQEESSLRDTARYTTDHEWVKFDDSTNIGVVGITDYAQKALGDVVFVELPAVGSEVGQGGASNVHRRELVLI